MMGIVASWYQKLIPELQKYVDEHGNKPIYVVRTVEPIEEHYVIRAWSESRQKAADVAIEPRKPERMMAKDALDEMKMRMRPIQ